MLLWSKLTVAVALVLVLSQIQCVALCTEECIPGSHGQQDVPPCHRHQGNSNAPKSAVCANPAAAAALLPTHPQASTGFLIDANVPPCSSVRFAVMASFESIAMTTDSPPGQASASSAVLRI